MKKGSSLSNINSLEDHNNGGRDFVGDGGDLLGGFSWPPRSYTCTFCKREFRSAQALGGHMNVHRRDRARLRQIPSSSDPSLHHHNFSSNYSLINLNLDPNKHPHSNPNSKPNPHPNPNLTPYCFSSMSSPLISSSPSSLNPNFPCVSHSTTHSAYRLHQSLTMMKSQISPYGVCRYDSFRDENEGKIVKNSEIVTLNLEIGLLGESKADDLDLELRLGCS